MKKTLLKFSIEAVLIVLSILLALWIDNRKEISKERKLKSELFKRLYADIRDDSVNFSAYLKRRSRTESNLTALIAYVNAKDIRQDSLAALLNAVEWFAGYSPSNSTYNSIVSSGQVTLFEGDTLFLNIGKYYQANGVVAGMSEAYVAGANRFMVPFLNEHFDRRLFHEKGNARKIDLGKFTETAFVNICYSLSDRLIYEGYLRSHQDKQKVLLGQIRPLVLE
ncbi:MAG TPA: DUF6090 family protein [Chryseosolibacter sp.]|nr:DUF6090 family protein [Chryseosolibacter sp.]